MLRHVKSSSSTTNSLGKKPIHKHVPDTICQYKPRQCHQTVLDQYQYCIKHILEDKNAPYKPCGYAYPINNKRCLVPAPRGDNNDGYCALHSWTTQLKGQRSGAKHVPPITPEYLLSGLSHYVKPLRSIAKSENEVTCRTKAINPFADAEVSKAAQARNHVLECASDSDSDVEAATMDSVWRGTNEDSSDAESIDSQTDDPLKHAGYYTPEEVLSITRNKLMRLQGLYHKQFERLTYLLKEKRRRYLTALRKEKETLTSIHDQAKTSAKEQKLYEKLKALNRYHKRSNAESVAYLAHLEKRNKFSGPHYKPLGHSSRCAFTEGGVRCPKVTIPLTKFCYKHIIEDPNQCLFKACGCVKADTKCQETVRGLYAGETCILHVKLPAQPHLNNFPDSIIKSEMDMDKKSIDGSEMDASATESAFSTDNRDSPENSIIHGDEIVKIKDPLEVPLSTDAKVNFPENGETDLHHDIIDDPKMDIDVTQVPNCDSTRQEENLPQHGVI